MEQSKIIDTLETYHPTAVAVFCMFLTSQEINTKRSPNAAKLLGDFSGPEDTCWAK